MLWLVPSFRDFLLPLLLPRTFGVVVGNLYGVLSDRSVGKLAARPGNPQSGKKTAKCSIQVVVVHFWCSRNHQPGYQTFPIQVASCGVRSAGHCGLNRECQLLTSGCNEGLTWSTFKSIFASTANQAFSTCSGRVRLPRAVQGAALSRCTMHDVCRATPRFPGMSGFIECLRPHDECNVSLRRACCSLTIQLKASSRCPFDVHPLYTLPLPSTDVLDIFGWAHCLDRSTPRRLAGLWRRWIVRAG